MFILLHSDIQKPTSFVSIQQKYHHYYQKQSSYFYAIFRPISLIIFLRKQKTKENKSRNISFYVLLARSSLASPYFLIYLVLAFYSRLQPSISCSTSLYIPLYPSILRNTTTKTQKKKNYNTTNNTVTLYFVYSLIFASTTFLDSH
jgi:hypothetical protein